MLSPWVVNVGASGGQRKYARHRKCTLSAIQKAIAAGRIHGDAVRTDERGRVIWIDFALADQQWAANTDPAEALKNGKSTSAPVSALPALGAAIAPSATEQPGPPATEAAPELPLEPSGAVAGGKPAEDQQAYLKERAEREKIQRQIAELDYLERVGALVGADEVRKEQFEILRELRDNLLLIGPRISQRLAAETDPLRIEQIINENLRAVLNELSRSYSMESTGEVAERATAVS